MPSVSLTIIKETVNESEKISVMTDGEFLTGPLSLFFFLRGQYHQPSWMMQVHDTDHTDPIFQSLGILKFHDIYT